MPLQVLTVIRFKQEIIQKLQKWSIGLHVYRDLSLRTSKSKKPHDQELILSGRPPSIFMEVAT